MAGGSGGWLRWNWGSRASWGNWCWCWGVNGRSWAWGEHAGGWHSLGGGERAVSDRDCLAGGGSVGDRRAWAGNDQGGAAWADGGVRLHNGRNSGVAGLGGWDTRGEHCGGWDDTWAVGDGESLRLGCGVGLVLLNDGRGCRAEGGVFSDRLLDGSGVWVCWALGGLDFGAWAVGDGEGGGRGNGVSLVALHNLGGCWAVSRQGADGLRCGLDIL